MAISALPLELSGFDIEQTRTVGQDVLVVAKSNTRAGVCPGCRKASTHTHGWYHRQPSDVPCVGKRVCLHLRVRRFRCTNPHCSRQTFAQDCSGWLPLFARRTTRLTQLAYHFGFEVGGECAARLLRRCAVQLSGDTILRILRAHSVESPRHARIIGVDDWAFKKGQRYGTIIVDLEAHRVIDLLPDRTASTVQNWLQDHPEVEVVARDRSTEYAAGIVAGAPQAVQVADRWHLLLNVRQMVERFLSSIIARLQQLPLSDEAATCLRQKRRAFRRTRSEGQASLNSRDKRLARYQRIRQMRQDGYNIAQIAQILGHHRETVRKYYYATSFPERKRRQAPNSILNPYLAYLEYRYEQGCENAMQLWREIQSTGYSGSHRQVSKWMQLRRTKAAPTTPYKYRDAQFLAHANPQKALPSTKHLAWLLVRDTKCLKAEDRLILQHLQQDDDVRHVQILTQKFICMIKQQQPDLLDPWLKTCLDSSVTQVTYFAQGILHDYQAVRAALETSWSNGQTEGQVNRLKFIKRQMFGRAHFDLLRLRVIHPP